MDAKILISRALALVVLAVSMSVPRGPASIAHASEEETLERVPLSTARANEKGNELLRQREFDAAAEVYRDEALKRPDNGVLQRNLAGALARSEQVEEALSSYSQALRFAETDRERARTLYDLGNTLVAGGQTQQAMDAYAQAMLLAPDDLDIKHNFEFILKQMSQQSQDQQQQQQQDQEQQEDPGDDGGQGQGEQPEEQPQDADQQPDSSPESEEQDQQQSPQSQEEPASPQDPEEMDPQDAQRILDAMLEEEKELQNQLAKMKIKERRQVEKDW